MLLKHFSKKGFQYFYISPSMTYYLIQTAVFYEMAFHERNMFMNYMFINSTFMNSCSS